MQSYDTNRQPARPRAGYNNPLPAPTRDAYIYAGVGALLGLIVGLVIAWAIWPVQWTSAWPADLSQEARAQYLAAVSEAYVYYGSPEAAEVARNRLFNLNDDLPAYIADAQKFFVDNPQASSRVYIGNLGQLAQALNVQSPDIIIDTPVDVAPVAPAPAEASSAGDSVGDTVRAWVNWAFTVLAAIILVGGGFYVVGRLNQRRLATHEDDTLDDGGFDDEPGSGGFRPSPTRGAQNPFARPTRGSVDDVAPVAPQGAPARQQDDYGGFGGFDEDDDDDEFYAQSVASRALDYRNEDEIFEVPRDDDFADDELEDSLDNVMTDVMDDGMDDPFDTPQSAYVPQTREQDRVAAESDQDYDLDLEDDLDDDNDFLESEIIAAPAVVAPSSRAPTGVRTLDTYTFQYMAGIADYDQSRPIVDQETGLQVGDCGMGVNMKNNIVQNNPDNVIALDVWLVDKKQEKSFSSQDRVLLSEYVVDHNLETTFTRERPNDPSPIIPQPGTTFQIKGPSLTLDCLVTDVTYINNGTAAGMFQSLSIDMTVRSRG